MKSGRCLNLLEGSGRANYEQRDLGRALPGIGRLESTGGLVRSTDRTRQRIGEPRTGMTHAPFVRPEVRDGRLVRVCPECGEEIVELTDEDGMVSNRMAEHHEAEHSAAPEPEKQRSYLLAVQRKADGGLPSDARRGVSEVVLRHVGEQFAELEWELVDCFEELPEEAPVLQAADALRGMWRSDDDPPQVRQVRWYERRGDDLVFTPTRNQIDEWNAASRRANDFRGAWVERHRDQLPTFEGESVEDFDDWYPGYREREQELTREFDAQVDVARYQFYTGEPRWAITLEAAVGGLEIAENEAQEYRARMDERFAAAAQRKPSQ